MLNEEGNQRPGEGMKSKTMEQYTPLPLLELKSIWD